MAQTSANFSQGSVILGNDTRSCGGALEGNIKYQANFNNAVSHWTLDDTNATALDSIGSNDGSMVNGLTGVSDSVAGIVDEALLFSGGADEGIVIPYGASLNLTQGTWSLWYKSDGSWGTDGSDPTNAAVLMQQATASAASGLTIGKASGSNWVGILAKDVTDTVVCQANGSIAAADGLDNTWHHVLGTFSTVSGETMEIYVDGTLSASCTNSAAWAFAGDDLLIGDTIGTWSEEFKGTMDDVRIYGRKLTTTEIAELAALDPGKALQYCDGTIWTDF